jgi:hypothetical protein
MEELLVDDASMHAGLCGACSHRPPPGKPHSAKRMPPLSGGSSIGRETLRQDAACLRPTEGRPQSPPGAA